MDKRDEELANLKVSLAAVSREYNGSLGAFEHTHQYGRSPRNEKLVPRDGKNLLNVTRVEGTRSDPRSDHACFLNMMQKASKACIPDYQNDQIEFPHRNTECLKTFGNKKRALDIPNHIERFGFNLGNVI